MGSSKTGHQKYPLLSLFLELETIKSVNPPTSPLMSASAKGGLRSLSKASWCGLLRNISRTVAGSCSPPGPCDVCPAWPPAVWALLPGSWMLPKSILGKPATVLVSSQYKFNWDSAQDSLYPYHYNLYQKCTSTKDKRQPFPLLLLMSSDLMVWTDQNVNCTHFLQKSKWIQINQPTTSQSASVTVLVLYFIIYTVH